MQLLKTLLVLCGIQGEGSKNRRLALKRSEHYQPFQSAPDKLYPEILRCLGTIKTSNRLMSVSYSALYHRLVLPSPPLVASFQSPT